MNSRLGKAKLNIIVSFICQISTLLCGFIVPQLFIKTYGSEAYGVTASITQFLAYISLLEGGVAGVARAALYKPLAEDNINAINGIVKEIKHFFRIIGLIFLLYVLILSISFKQISNVSCFDWLSTATLVVVLSISVFAQYFIGISYSVLLQASQRQYISNAINIMTTIINTVAIIVLVNFNFNIITVKFCSSIIFVFRPLLMWIYVKKNFNLVKGIERNSKALSQKWNALGQHIAYFLHSNTDIAVLTIFGNLKMVAVYSVYHMVVASIQNLTASFSAGMEAVFGDMLAKSEFDALHKSFGYYDTLISSISIVLFSLTGALIVPFVKVYTLGVTDANYIEPLFAVLLVISSLIFCLRLPYHAMIVAAGHFKQTQTAGYGEAIINIVFSVALVIKFGIIGVAAGTVAAVSFRFLFYVMYLRSNILNRKTKFFAKRIAIDVLLFTLIQFFCKIPMSIINISGYTSWFICAIICGAIAILATLAINCVFYTNDVKMLFKKVIRTK